MPADWFQSEGSRSASSQQSNVYGFYGIYQFLQILNRHLPSACDILKYMMILWCYQNVSYGKLIQCGGYGKWQYRVKQLFSWSLNATKLQEN